MEFGNLGSAVFEWVEDICRNYVLFSSSSPFIRF